MDAFIRLLTKYVKAFFVTTITLSAMWTATLFVWLYTNLEGSFAGFINRLIG